MIDSFLKDLALAWRRLGRTPAFTALGVLTLSLGIGGTTTLFTAVNAAYLRPLPYPAPDQLVMVWQTAQGGRRLPISMLNALDWDAQKRSLQTLAIMNVNSVNVTGGPQPQRATAAYVTRDFFTTLGISPILGRSFSAEETKPGGGTHVTVIGYRLWQRAFNKDREVLKKPLSIEGVDFNVVGVMPEGLSFPDNAELWRPLDTDDGSDRSAHNYRIVARIKPGVSLKTAQTDMETLAARLAAAYPEANKGLGAEVVPLRNELLGHGGQILLILLSAVSFVLLISCANVTNLLLARSVSRQAETTMRLALGANRTALIRPFLTESLVLAFLGSVIGLALTFAAVKSISSLVPPGLASHEAGLAIDGTVLLFTFGVAVLVALLCGIAPALRASRQAPRLSLAAGARSVVGGRERRGMNLLIVSEVAITFLLLAGAGLLIRTARHLETVAPGFDTSNVTLLSFTMVSPPGSRYADEAWRTRFFSQLLRRIKELPGAKVAGLINQPPLSGRSFPGTLETSEPSAQGSNSPLSAHYRLTGGDYFKAMGIPLLQGRLFSQDDQAHSPHVALVNRRLAKSLSQNGDVIGKKIKIPGMDSVEEWATIVGVVGDVHHLGVAQNPVPEAYFNYLQRPNRSWEMSVVVRTAGDPQALKAQLEAAVRALDHGLPLQFDTMSHLLSADLAPVRFRSHLLAIFAVTALLLAAIGIYGVVSYAVGSRRREVAIRIALGAEHRRVRSLLVRNGMTPVLIGMAIGLFASIALTRVLASLLFGVEATDLMTFSFVVLLIGATTLVATYVPSVRATKIDPSTALRAD
ncbi:MAG TPA: ABC transporter permease [Thermoanaerobaculia bacterium]|jgi:putative ABC transport system permease protein|nr:ABC transporter permease [Thermoanaerobaculia bacterium]